MPTSTNVAQQAVEIIPTFSESAVQISEAVEQTLQQHFNELKQETPKNLYKIVVAKAEASLLKFAMEQYRYNQSHVAQILGLSRGTLRTKLQQYFGDKYVGTRGNKTTE
ncbi:MAG: helix-turn-helix domain-containing protein [Gammaproteobacteria bacterium]